MKVCGLAKIFLNFASSFFYMQQILCLHFSGSSNAIESVRKIRAMQAAHPNAEIHVFCSIEFPEVFSLVIDRALIHTEKPNGISFDKIYDLSPEATTFWTKLTIGSWPKPWTDMASVDFIKEVPIFDLASTGITGKYIVYALEGEFVTQVLDYPNIVRLLDKLDTSIILLGNSWDENLGYRFNKIFPEKVHNLCKVHSHSEMAAIMRGAEFIITHDSPMLKIAQILGKKTFAIFGPTTTTLPASDSLTILENKGLGCRPCAPKLLNYCPLNHLHCMKDIDLSPIIHASKTL